MKRMMHLLLVLSVAATLSLGAETVYYAKPDAVGAETDGTSWDAATSLTNALALAGANVPAFLELVFHRKRHFDEHLLHRRPAELYGRRRQQLPLPVESRRG